MRSITPNLWINDGRIEEAVAFWCSVFEDSRILGDSEYGDEAGEDAGQKMVISFELNGQPFAAINGAGTEFTPNESLSLAVPCDTQDEIDRVWHALVDGGKPGPCGWLRDRLGFSWQVYPAVLDQMMTDSDPAKVHRVTACFMKLDGEPFSIADLEAAYEGR